MKLMLSLLVALFLSLPAFAHPNHEKKESASLAPGSSLKLEDYEVGNYPIGGDFKLTNQDGGTTRLKDLRGKAVLLAFGYTHCPDVCPATLAKFKAVKAALGREGRHMAGVFISVDPQRDSPAVLKKWVRNFDSAFLGLTGSQDQVNTVIGNYMGKALVRKSAAATIDAVDHTAFIYLLDPTGKVRYLFTVDASNSVLAAGVKAVLARS